ncbi:hypothetical protein [Amycolatopsis saalfeldensis]|uniref:Uncharacterized protein n=1 Tax=Amycolatopsis saalfeldensis TaxID=394193 RepID=A0A1H8Y6T8_9PSEU|nr:hypothetical protein [Amycolatopsis saalfeldensis]SEP48000.1 hypothetical protein SAMN04489732_111274 [Amycolatopsis saalfeldensis]
MISNMKLTNPGTGLSTCGVMAAPRQGTDVSTSAHAPFGTHRVERSRGIFGITLANTAAVVGAYPQVDADLPTIKQFRVPLSIRERSS